MDIVAAKEAMRDALEKAYIADNNAVVDRLWDVIYYLGWGSDFGVEEEEEGA